MFPQNILDVLILDRFIDIFNDLSMFIQKKLQTTAVKVLEIAFLHYDVRRPLYNKVDILLRPGNVTLFDNDVILEVDSELQVVDEELELKVFLEVIE